MKKLIAIVVVVTLFGCANQAMNQGTIEANAWVAQNKPLAVQGTMPWSAYYEGAYDKFSVSNVAGKGALLSRINNMISTAKAYERGEISADQFNSYRRNLESEQFADNEAIGRANEAARRANAAAAFEASQRISEANARANASSGYQIVQPTPMSMPTQAIQPPIRTNCTNTGNRTDCTTWPY